MAKNYAILIGTVGQGLNVSADGGESWTPIYQPIWHESNVRALCVDPANPRRVLAGVDGHQLLPSSIITLIPSGRFPQRRRRGDLGKPGCPHSWP